MPAPRTPAPAWAQLAAQAPPRTPAGTPRPGATPPAALSQDTIDALLAAEVVSPEQAQQLAALADTPAEDVQALADDLADEAAELLDDEGEGDDGEPIAASATTDDQLALAMACADAVEVLRGELTRRGERRAQTLARLRTQQPQGGTPPARRPPGARQRRQGAQGAHGGQVLHTVTASGRPLATDAELQALVVDATRAAAGPWSGKRILATRTAAYPEALTLGRDPSVNAARVAAVASPEVIVAAGGICAPAQPVYSMDLFASAARPIRDALPRFGADRGGVVTLGPPTLADVADGVGRWTNADDIAAAANTGAPTDKVKACVTLDCADELETLVEATTVCLRTGNFRQRFFPEQVAAAMKALGAVAARTAEQHLFEAMVAQATAVTVPFALSASRDLLWALDRALGSLRARLRMDDRQAMRLIGPTWVRDQLRTDIARTLPGYPDDNMALADATIASWFSVRNAAPVWSPDVDIAWALTQPAGALVNWPSTARFIFYPDGAYLWLDGGSLDLGLMRDSVLTSTNDLQFFSEASENVVLVQGEALAMTVTLNPTGAVSGTEDMTPAAPG